MALYKTKIVRHEEVADGTMAFHFEKPAGFEFKAGQFIEMMLLSPAEPGSENATASAEGGSEARALLPPEGGRKTEGSRISTAWETDSEGNSRAFSIASAPYEKDLMVATRMRDTAFKRVLKILPIGTEVQIKGPFGDFTLHNNVSRPAVFLMGGIGITPVRSIVIEAAQRNLPHKIFLFYSNRREKDAAFLKELQILETKNPNYKFIPTMTDVTEGDFSWQGERGYIDEPMLKKYLGNLQGPIYPHTRTASTDNSSRRHNSPFGVGVYYSAGPPAMVMAMRKMLNDAGVDDDDIRTEEFSGY